MKVGMTMIRYPRAPVGLSDLTSGAYIHAPAQDAQELKLTPTSALFYKGKYARREALYVTYRSAYAQSECFARQAVYTD